MKSKDLVRNGNGSNVREKDAFPDSGIQKFSSGFMPSAPVIRYFLPSAIRYESEDILIQ